MNLLIKIPYLICAILSITVNTSHSQVDNHYNNVLEALINDNISKAQDIVNSINNLDSKMALQWHINDYLCGVEDSISSIKPIIITNKRFKVLDLIKNAQIYKATGFQKDSLVYDNYKRALNEAKRLNDSTLIRFIYPKLFDHLLNNTKMLNILYDYTSDFEGYIKTYNDEFAFTYYRYTLESRFEKKSKIENFKKVLEKHKKSKDGLYKGMLHHIIGMSESVFNQDFDTAIEFYNKAELNYKASKSHKRHKKLFVIKNSMGQSYREKNDFKRSVNYYQEALKYNFGVNELRDKHMSYLALSRVYERMGKLDSALYYLKKEKATIATYNESELAKKQRDIEEKYDNEKLRADTLELESKRKTNRNLLIASLFVLLFGSITAYSLNKSTKRKQLLAEQGKALETQKVTTLMKEQELNAIDAMIEGQEKERQRIANDLHDDLGGLMATVKLHFNALEKKQSKDLFKKTNTLLDEAYQKIRNVAHAKNSGVIAKKGLLKAVNEMADKVSAANNLQIDVTHHGLENRLENSLELTIFRIIQELITNVIKHAQATEISIQITNHHEKLNIIVEDNGKGFNTSNIMKQSGMGIHSIDKRIENLGGTVNIDSKLERGTSVIIDVPI